MGNPYGWAAAIVAGSASLFAWTCMDGDSMDANDRGRARHPLRAGYAIEAPFAFLDDHGTVTGEAPEVLRHVLESEGLGRIEWIHADFGDLIHELEIGRIDIIAAGLFVTPERAQRVLFTRPIAVVRAGLLVPAANPLGLHALTDVARHQGARLAVLDGSVEVQYAAAAGIPPERVRTYADLPSAMSALENHSADAFALSTVSLRRILGTRTGGPFTLVTEPTPTAADDELRAGRPAFAFRSTDHALRDRVDHALAAFLGSQEHLALVHPFGIEPADVTPIAKAPRDNRR